MKNRTNLVEWLILVHNEVNIALGKPVLATEEVITDYNQRIHDTRYKTTYVDYIPYCLVLLCIILGIFLYKKL